MKPVYTLVRLFVSISLFAVILAAGGCRNIYDNADPPCEIKSKDLCADKNRKPITGLVRTFDKAGRILQAAEYVDGRPHGRVMTFYPDGSVNGFMPTQRNGKSAYSWRPGCSCRQPKNRLFLDIIVKE